MEHRTLGWFGQGLPHAIQFVGIGFGIIGLQNATNEQEDAAFGVIPPP